MSYESTLEKLASERTDVVVMTAENRAVIRGLPEKLGRRFIDTGICEQTLLGAAAGLALRGRTPVVHALAAFLTMRGFEFVRTDIGYPKLPVKLIGFVPGFLSDGNGPTHQAIEDIALMRGIPGMQIFCPADEDELVRGLPAVLASPAPVYVRYNQSAAAVEHADAPTPGKAEVLHRGDDVTLVTYGLLLEQAVEARKLLVRDGLSVGLINARWLAPLDSEALLSAAAESRLLVTIEDHLQAGGLYTMLAEQLVAHPSPRPCRLLPIALDQRWFRAGTLPEVLAYEGFTGSAIADRVRDAL